MEEEFNTFEDVLPCADKLAFDTKKQANGSAVAVDYQHDAKVKAYKCIYCHLWHLATDYDV